MANDSRTTTISRAQIRSFLAESNLIEGKHTVSTEEISGAMVFLERQHITTEDVCCCVYLTQPGAKLRELPGQNVRVGQHLPPPGGPAIRKNLDLLLEQAHEVLDPYATHAAYETLHPFTDGNGRSGRLLWLWQMLRLHGQMPSLGFLHTWYYQSLQGAREDAS